MTTTTDAIISAMRESLLAYGSHQGAFSDSVCSCDEPECAYRQPETYPVHVLLQDVARAVQHHDAYPEAEATADAEFRARLLPFGEHFGLFRCPCGEPSCPTSSAPAATLADLAYTVYVQWYAMSGCIGHEGPEEARTAAELAIRNLHAVRAWTRKLTEVPRAFIEEAIAAYAAGRSEPWRREAQILASECSDRWIPAFHQLPEVDDAMDLILVIAETGGWTDDQAQDWLLLTSDALLALMTRDLLNPAATQVLYSCVEAIIPVHHVRAALFAGTTGAPPGFFAFAA